MDYLNEKGRPEIVYVIGADMMWRSERKRKEKKTIKGESELRRFLNLSCKCADVDEETCGLHLSA